MTIRSYLPPYRNYLQPLYLSVTLYACAQRDNGHAFMISKIYKRVHLPVHSKCLVMVITMAGIMPFTKGMCAGFKKIKKT